MYVQMKHLHQLHRHLRRHRKLVCICNGTGFTQVYIVITDLQHTGIDFVLILNRICRLEIRIIAYRFTK